MRSLGGRRIIVPGTGNRAAIRPSRPPHRGTHDAPPTPDPSLERKDFGDFQTPPALVAEVLDALGPIGGRFARVLEPTCGRGHFLAGLLGRPDPPREIRGFEIQPEHAEVARPLARSVRPIRLVVEAADLFGLDLGRDLAGPNPAPRWWSATSPG